MDLGVLLRLVGGGGGGGGAVVFGVVVVREREHMRERASEPIWPCPDAFETALSFGSACKPATGRAIRQAQSSENRAGHGAVELDKAGQDHALIGLKLGDTLFLMRGKLVQLKSSSQNISHKDQTWTLGKALAQG